MKSIFCFFSSLIFSHLAIGAVIPVSEDTWSTSNGSIAKTAGKIGYLQIAPGGTGFVRFDVADFAGLISPDSVSTARLVMQISSVKKAGKIEIHRVNGEWTESAPANRPQPAFEAAALASVPAESVVADQFMMIDVTAQVKEWLTTPVNDFGFAVNGSDGANIQIASKEGAANGQSAWLEIESRPVIGNDKLASGIDAAKLGDGNVSNTEFSFVNGVLSPLQGQINTLSGSVASATTTAEGKVSKAGDTMTGPLVVPADGLKVGIDQLVLANGKAGVGTTDPQAKLDVRGDIRLGANGDFYAASSEENLRLVRVNLNWASPNLTASNPHGYTLSYLGIVSGRPTYKIIFTTPFSATPTYTFSYIGLTSGIIPVGADAASLTFAPANISNPYELSFVFVGPH